MEALANYDSDDDNNDKLDSYKDETPRPAIAGDNYDNVQMDLSEENSSSSSKTGGRPDSREEIRRTTPQCSDRSSGSSVKEEKRQEESRSRYEREHRARRPSPERDPRDRKRHSPEVSRGHHSSRHHGGSSRREDKHRADDSSSARHSQDGKSLSKRGGRERSPTARKRSRSPRHSRKRSRSRDRRDHKRSKDSARSRSSTPKEAASKQSNTKSGGAGSQSPTGFTSEQYQASLNMAQKLAQQAQPQQRKLGIGEPPVSLGALGLTGNPTLTRIQEQLQRRRMLWQHTKEPSNKEPAAGTSNNWEGALLPKDDDGTQTAKFKRLMGMKGSATEAATAAAAGTTDHAKEQLKRTDDMFNNMERQYEVARLATHTHRGLGLGFGAFQCNPR